MSAPFHPESPPPFDASDLDADDATIHLLADLVLDAMAHDRMAPAIVHFRRDGSTIDTEFQALGDFHPREYLLGYTVPDEYFAVGVAARGWAHHMDPGVEAPPERVSVVSIVSRTGEHAHVTATDDPDHPLNFVDGDQPEGEQVDLLRRALGLATPPPPCGPDTYWLLEWMASIVDEACSTVIPLDWKAVRDLHPSAQLLSLGGVEPGDHDFVDMVKSFARVCDWTWIRVMANDGGFGAVGLEPGDGSWFDEGSLARYLLSRCTPLAVLRREVDDVVRPSARRRIHAVLSAVGLPERVWPDIMAS